MELTPQAATVAAYDRFALAYAQARAAPTSDLISRLDEFIAALPTGVVLEIGSGPGIEASHLRDAGVRVVPSDISQGFVDILRDKGFDARRIDPLTDDLGGPYAGVLAQACLLHVARHDLPTVLRRLREVTVTGGLLGLSLKEGDGEGWSTHGGVAAPRHFTYWREPELREALADAGWRVRRLTHLPGGEGKESWLDALAQA